MRDFQTPEFQHTGFADQLNIQTPEQVDLRFPVAGVGSRFVALLVDHLIQLSPYIALMILGIIFSASGAGHSSAPVKAGAGTDDIGTWTKWFIAGIVFVNFVWIWGYFSLFEAFWKGQTPGKRVMKLRVIKDTGRQITLFEALARNLIRFVDYLPGVYLVGLITMFCNKKNKRLGDLAAGTLVVHELPADDRAADTFLSGENFFAPAQSAVAPVEANALAADTVARLTSADLHMIDTFFARALDLDMETRATMASRMAARLAAKMGVAVPEGNPERMLEGVGKQMRGMGKKF